MSEEYSLNEVNKPKDWSNLPNMAKKHVPIIDAPASVKADQAFPVKIKIGGIDGVEHPNTLSHWINWVELYAGERLIHRTEFAPELTDGYVVTLDISLATNTTLKAKAYCNLHGVWEAKEKKVTVE
ncbi:MAG: class II SORL domain-containing protein [Candidatus Ranarchaeia archaeon]